MISVVGDRAYRPLPVHESVGLDLALQLRSFWSAIEEHAEPLLRLYRQFAKVQFELLDEGPARLLCVKISLPEPNQQLRLLLNDHEARYYWDRNGELIAIDPHERQLDRAVHLILAELARQHTDAREAAAYVES